MSFPIQSMRLFFSITKVIAFYERNKENNKLFLFNLSYVPSSKPIGKQKVPTTTTVISTLKYQYKEPYAAFALATIALKASG